MLIFSFANKFGLLLSFVFYFSVTGFTQQNSVGDLVFEIHFQENFKNDTVSVCIDTCKIEQKYVLNSNDVMGFAGSRIRGVHRNKHKMQIEYGDVLGECGYKRKIMVRIFLHQNEFDFLINLKAGKYIGFYRYVPDGEIRMIQSSKPFNYM